VDRDHERALDGVPGNERLVGARLLVDELVEQLIRVWLQPADLARRWRRRQRVCG